MSSGGNRSALVFAGVSKRYGELEALRGIDLRVEPGEIFALLGPNGAGKTTAIGCASGLIQDFEGSISVGGFDVRRDYRITRRLVGLVPQELNYDGFFSVRETLQFQAGYFGFRPSSEEIDDLLRRFSLYSKAGANTRQLSGGMKRRLMVCKALTHKPAVLFLDEPTAGVDVELREELWENVRELKRSGVTIVLTTHYLEEAEQLADRIGIIDAGRIARCQPREEMLSELGKRWVEARFSGPVDAEELQVLGLGEAAQLGPDRVRIDYRPDDRLPGGEHLAAGMVDFARERGIVVVDLRAGRSSLEEIFRGLVRRDRGSQAAS